MCTWCRLLRQQVIRLRKEGLAPDRDQWLAIPRAALADASRFKCDVLATASSSAYLMVLQRLHALFDSCIHCKQSVPLLANYPRPHAVDDRTGSDELAKIRKERSTPNPRHNPDIFLGTLKKATKRLRQMSWPRCEMGPSRKQVKEWRIKSN